MALPALALAIKALKVTKAVANTLGTKPTPTPEVKVKNTKKYKPRAGDPGTDVKVEFDKDGYQID